MKGQIAFLLLVGISISAHAETIGEISGGFLFGNSIPGDPTDSRVRAPAPAQRPKPNPEVVAAPPPPVRPTADRPTPPVPNTGAAPFQASIDIGSTRCPDPRQNPNARNTPVKVYVDQQTQRVQIVSPDLAKPLESVVSTGGGLKIPNGELKKAPYCARTPSYERRIISAVKPEMFKGTGCTNDEIRAKSTVFPMYHTRTFTDAKGNPIPMPNATRIAGGIFFHEVPPSYRKMLGHNVSGECVRLQPNVAKFLREQTEKYGAIEVTIGEPPTVARNMPQYCDAQMIANIGREQRSPEPTAAAKPRPAPTGSEGVYGGEDNFFSMLGRIFGGGQQPQQRAPARRPTPPRPEWGVPG